MSRERESTEEIRLPTPEQLVMATCRRIRLALKATEDIDEDTLRLLARRLTDGKTQLQTLVNETTWHVLPALRRKEPE